MARSRVVVLGACAAAIAAACASSTVSDEQTRIAREPVKFAVIAPLANVWVKTAGELDVETEYLPQVTCCENGSAHIEALKAQAVMARTYMYFRHAADGLGTSAKPFSGTAADQAYFCSTKVSTACLDAVAATRDQITSYTNASGVAIANASFYIDGPRPACIAKKSCNCPMPTPSTEMSPQNHPACDCFTFASMGAANPAFVTYNWPYSGTNVVGTTLGSLTNESNRGCGSQNIQNCLGWANWNYYEMLRFFYGQDLELRSVEGEIVAADGGFVEDGGTVVPDGGVVTVPDGGTDGGETPNDPGDDGCAVGRSPGGGHEASYAWLVALLALVAARRRS